MLFRSLLLLFYKGKVLRGEGRMDRYPARYTKDRFFYRTPGVVSSGGYCSWVRVYHKRGELFHWNTRLRENTEHTGAARGTEHTDGRVEQGEGGLRILEKKRALSV